MRCAFILTVTTLLTFTTLAQAQLTVPSATYPTIQSAIDAAVPTNSIVVLPGTYNENLDMKGKAITLTGIAGPASTIIDGGSAVPAAPVIKIITGETRATIVRGFTIRNGNNTSTSPVSNGGGMNIIGASPTVTNCIFRNNNGAGYGGGLGTSTVGASGSSPLIEDCQFIANTARGASYASGAGVAIAAGGNGPISSPEIRRCFFADNVATQRGGGLYTSYNGNALVEDCVFTRNETQAVGTGLEGGGGIYISLLSNAVVRNCVVYANRSGGNGGGVKYFNTITSTFTNNTIVNNINGGVAGFANTGVGGTTVLADFNNCIIYGNGATEISFTGAGSTSIPPNANVNYCDVAGGFPGTLNISGNPLLANAASGNVRLLAGSPCIDAGNGSAAQLPLKDFEGDPRVVGSSPDIGADERVSTSLLLYADRGAITVSSPGTTNFAIEGGTFRSGYLYVLLASLSGTSPGFPYGGKQIPINLDSLTPFALSVFPTFIGTLNGSGRATPAMPLGGGSLDPYLGLAGLQMSFAAVTFNSGLLDAVSNNEIIRLVP